MKKQIRTIGIDDAAFTRDKSSKTFVFGVIVRGSNLVEGIVKTEIVVDGLDATNKIGKMIIQSKFSNQLKAIILNSTTIGAFNIINMYELYEITGIPVITILTKLPNDEEVEKALSNFTDFQKRFETLQNNPSREVIIFENQNKQKCKVYVQQIGLESIREVKMLLSFIVNSSCVPECLRLADLIGKSFKDFIF